MNRYFAHLRRSETGAVAVEFALIGAIAIALLIGIIEFGRGLYFRHEMSYAMDLAVRKIMMNSAIPNDELDTLIRDAIGFDARSELQIAFGTEAVDGIDFRTVLIQYPLSLLIPGFSDNGFTLAIDRRVPIS